MKFCHSRRSSEDAAMPPRMADAGAPVQQGWWLNSAGRSMSGRILGPESPLAIGRRIGMTSQLQRFLGPARALLVIDPRVLADVVNLALGQGHYTTRVAETADQVSTALADWRPHLLVVDMDIAERG